MNTPIITQQIVYIKSLNRLLESKSTRFVSGRDVDLGFGWIRSRGDGSWQWPPFEKFRVGDIPEHDVALFYLVYRWRKYSSGRGSPSPVNRVFALFPLGLTFGYMIAWSQMSL